MEYSLFYITTSNFSEARRIGKILVEERVAACVNIIDGMHSMYRWNGKFCEDTEAILIAKTVKELSAVLIDRVLQLHSYSCPCIIELPVLNGNPAFLAWIEQETQQPL